MGPRLAIDSTARLDRSLTMRCYGAMVSLFIASDAISNDRNR
jgi:hypothetical protein